MELTNIMQLEKLDKEQLIELAIALYALLYDKNRIPNIIVQPPAAQSAIPQSPYVPMIVPEQPLQPGITTTPPFSHPTIILSL
jgi:hypothetical protein